MVGPRDGASSRGRTQWALRYTGQQARHGATLSAPSACEAWSGLPPVHTGPTEPLAIEAFSPSAPDLSVRFSFRLPQSSLLRTHNNDHDWHTQLYFR